MGLCGRGGGCGGVEEAVAEDGGGFGLRRWWRRRIAECG